MPRHGTIDGGGTIATATLKTLNLSFERFAGQFLPLGLLLGGEQCFELRSGCRTCFFELLARRLAVLATATTLKRAAHFVVDSLYFFFLLGGQAHGLGHLVIA